MTEHRLRDYLTTAQPVAVATPDPVAFVPCPVIGFYSPAQFACVAEVYRLAREMTAAQLASPKFRAFPPAFSLN